MRWLLSLVSILALILCPLAPLTLAKGEEVYPCYLDNPDIPYISCPGNIPNLHNFATPQMAPGDSGIFKLQLTNRYIYFDGQDLANVNLTAEIYMRADIDDSEPIDQVKRKPSIMEANGLVGINSLQEMRWEWPVIAPNATVYPSFNISTQENTDQGTYFVRFALEFEHNGTSRIMLSRGHWNATAWEDATSNATDDDPGNIDLSILGVDGIIPDSSFGVKKPIPRWPLYVLLCLTVFFGGLAVVFYLEEEGTYPQLNKWLQQQRGKLEQLRLLFENRRRHP